MNRWEYVDDSPYSGAARGTTALGRPELPDGWRDAESDQWVDASATSDWRGLAVRAAVVAVRKDFPGAAALVADARHALAPKPKPKPAPTQAPVAAPAPAPVATTAPAPTTPTQPPPP